MVVLGDRIKKIREEKGLSQKQVALNVGIDRGQYSRIETNKVEPTLSTLDKIAKAFDLMIEDIIKKDEPLTVNSFDKNLVERVKLIDSLDTDQKEHILAVIDMAVANKRLKNTLSNALNNL